MFRLRHLVRSLVLLSVLAAAAAIGWLPSHAAKEPVNREALSGTSFLTASPAPRLELLVFEADACGYCEIFRRDVAPGYSLAPLAATAPLRFVDIGKVDLDRIGLTARLEVLPTTVLMRDGHEVERITGLTAPSTFYVLLKHMLDKNGG